MNSYSIVYLRSADMIYKHSVSLISAIFLPHYLNLFLSPPHKFPSMQITSYSLFFILKLSQIDLFSQNKQKLQFVSCILITFFLGRKREKKKHGKE